MANIEKAMKQDMTNLAKLRAAKNKSITKDFPQIGWAYINMVGVVDVVRNEEEIPSNAFPIFADADLVQASRNVISEIAK